jgi:hypothetical protein
MNSHFSIETAEAIGEPYRFNIGLVVESTIADGTKQRPTRKKQRSVLWSHHNHPGSVPATPVNIASGAFKLSDEDRSPRIPVKRFKFRIGALVRFHDFLCKVVDRSPTWEGNQLYTIEIIGESYGRPIRMTMMDHLIRFREASR